MHEELGGLARKASRRFRGAGPGQAQWVSWFNHHRLLEAIGYTWPDGCRPLRDQPFWLTSTLRLRAMSFATLARKAAAPMAAALMEVLFLESPADGSDRDGW